MQTENRSMQIITRRANERILIDRQLTVTVVEVLENEVALEIAGPDGETQQVTLRCDAPGPVETVAVETELVGC